MASEEEIEKICPFCQGIFVQSKIKDHIEFAHSELIFKGNKNEAVDEDTKEALLSSEQRICPFCHDSFDRNEIKDHVGIAHLKPIILGNHDREDIKEPILTSLGLNPKVILKKLTPEELQGFNRNMAPNQTLENVEFSLENEMCKLLGLDFTKDIKKTAPCSENFIEADDANGADWDYYDQDWQPECKKEKRSYDYYYDEDQYEPPYKAPKSSSKPRKNQDGSKKMGRPAKYKTIEVEVKAESYLENQEAMDETQEKVVHYRCEEHNLTFEYLKKMYLHNKKYHPENVHKRNATGKSEVEVKAESYLENPELMDDNKDQKVGEDGFDDKMIKKEFQEDQSGVQGKRKPISCCLCDMRFEDTDLLKLHTKQLHCNDTKDSLDCHECPARYPLKKYQEFLYHLKVHHGLGDYLNKCDQCDQVFETKQHLHRHKMNKHSKKRLVFCQKCGKCFQTMGGLHGHMLHVHGEHKVTPQDKIKKCDTCDLDFESPLLLDMHLKSCLKEFKDFPCKFCDSRWVSHLSLELHLAVEHNKLMVVCEVCGSVLRDKYYLSSHMKQVHEKTRSVVCHICARVLSTKGRLNEHLAAVHGIGEKKYQCDICQERFAAKQMLNEHFEKVHDTDNVYQCSYCPKTFQVKGYLRTHVKNIHGNHKPNKCDVCDAAFLTKRDLLKHKSSVH